MDNYSIHTEYYDENLMKEAKHIYIFYNGKNLQNILNNIPENVKSLSIHNVIFPVIIPEHIETLSVANNSKLELIKYNKDLRTLVIESQDMHLKNFPVNLESLTIYSSQIKTLSVPDNLKKLDLFCICLNLPILPELEYLHIYCENDCSIDFLPHSLKTLSLQSYSNSFNLSNLPINLYKLKIHGFSPDLTNVNVKYVKYFDKYQINFPLSVEKINSQTHPRNIQKLSNLRELKCDAGDVDTLYVPQQLRKLDCSGYDKIVFPDNTEIKEVKVKNGNIRLAQIINLPEENVRMKGGYQVWRKENTR